MMNSRARMTPKRGRRSSRNLVWMWYRFLGSYKQLPRNLYHIQTKFLGSCL